jgi:beta-lactamase class A
MRGTLAVGALVAMLLLAAPARASVASARAWAGERSGRVTFAVLRPGGRISGLRSEEVHPSASVVKAMMLVAALRAARDRPLTAAERAHLEPMIHVSDNDAARWVHAVLVGDAGLLALGRAAGMRHLVVLPGGLFSTGITAADQVRLFAELERLLPARHLGYAEHLLRDVQACQAWGIPAALRPRGYTVLFKGGWRTGLVNQVALARNAEDQLALAVLTSGSPSKGYAARTVAGIARRVTSSGRPSSGTNGPADRSATRRGPAPCWP